MQPFVYLNQPIGILLAWLYNKEDLKINGVSAEFELPLALVQGNSYLAFKLYYVSSLLYNQ